VKGWLLRLDWALGIALMALVLLAIRYFYYFVLLHEQLVRLWLGT